MTMLDTLKGLGAPRAVEAPEGPDTTTSAAPSPPDPVAEAVAGWTVRCETLARVRDKAQTLARAIAATDQALEDIARRAAHEQAEVDRGTAAQVHEGAPAPSLAALLAFESDRVEQRARRAAMLRQRETLGAELRVVERGALIAERALNEIQNAVRRTEIDGLSAQIAELDRARQNLLFQTSWFAVNRGPALERRLSELREPQRITSAESSGPG
jgi:hypothetical protein